LGIVIVLLVALLVVGFYQIRLQQELAAGKRVVGTIADELAGIDLPEEEIGTSEVLSAGPKAEPRPSPATRPATRAFDESREAADRRAVGEAGAGRAEEGAE
jgi:hypothetical protein